MYECVCIYVLLELILGCRQEIQDGFIAALPQLYTSLVASFRRAASVNPVYCSAETGS